MKRRYVWLPIAVVLSVLSAACGGDTSTPSPTPTKAETQEPSVTITSPQDASTVKGNVVELKVEASDFKIVDPDGDVSGKTGHFHAFVDREPVPAGAVIPKEPGIFHSAKTPVLIPGLAVGDHTVKVVLGDGAHKRIGAAEDAIKVTVQGPSVHAAVICPDGQPCPASPAEFPAGAVALLQITTQGFNLVAAKDDTSPTPAPGQYPAAGHLHILVDPASNIWPPSSTTIPSPSAIPAEEANRYIHTTSTTYQLKGLGAGEHTLWIVVGDKTHFPFNSIVADKVTLKVAEAAAPGAPAASPAATASGAAASPAGAAAASPAAKPGATPTY